MHKPTSPQIDQFIDLIVEAVLREMEDESQKRTTANAATPTKDERGVLETSSDYSNIE
jgi:hypothetical protein